MTDVSSLIENSDALARTAAHRTVLDALAAGVAAAHPERVVAEAISFADGHLRVAGTTYDLRAVDRIVVLGGGKAAGQVAVALEACLDDVITGGVVVTNAPAPADRVTIVEAAHPIPDERGVEGARRVLEVARRADEATLVLGVITGGASALLPAPAGQLTLADLQASTQALLESGAPIEEINAVRKHCSAIKGGRLAAAAAPATIVSLVFSDVVGDDLATIASGPTVADPTTYRDALDVLERHDCVVPTAVRDHLEAGARGQFQETPAPNYDGVDADHHVLANAWTAISAARDVASEAGFDPVVLSSRVRGEAREQGLAHATIAEECHASANPVAPPAALLSGGETTVTVRGDGEGGPNQEFALRAALELPPGAVLGAIDTDGTDGPTAAAGALVDAETIPDTATAARARDALAANDAGGYLAERGRCIRTGHTGTNVNDLRILILE